MIFHCRYFITARGKMQASIGRFLFIIRACMKRRQPEWKIFRKGRTAGAFLILFSLSPSGNQRQARRRPWPEGIDWPFFMKYN